MASWMVHLRVADALLDSLPNLTPTEFIVGNIAPDSGVPNADWSAFSPPTSVSHFKTAGKKADPGAFAAKYLTRRQDYSPEQFSFYLGYLTHLLTDVLWSEQIARPALDRKKTGMTWILSTCGIIRISGHSGSIRKLWISGTAIWRNFPRMPLTTAAGTSPASIWQGGKIWTGSIPT